MNLQESVKVTLADGVERSLFYTIGFTMKILEDDIPLLADDLKKADMIKLVIRRLPFLIVEGLRDVETGELPKGVDDNLILKLPSEKLMTLVNAFLTAWRVSQAPTTTTDEAQDPNRAVPGLALVPTGTA